MMLHRLRPFLWSALATFACGLSVAAAAPESTVKFDCAGLVLTVDLAANTVKMWPMPDSGKPYPARISEQKIEWWCGDDGICDWTLDRANGATVHRVAEFRVFDRRTCTVQKN